MAWVPSKLPAMHDADGQALASWLEDELQRLASGLISNNLTYQLAVSYVAPVRPRTGMMAYADGTKWNPGSGEGLYVYTIAGAWHKCSN